MDRQTEKPGVYTIGRFNSALKKFTLATLTLATITATVSDFADRPHGILALTEKGPLSIAVVPHTGQAAQVALDTSTRSGASMVHSRNSPWPEKPSLWRVLQPLSATSQNLAVQSYSTCATGCALKCCFYAVESSKNSSRVLCLFWGVPALSCFLLRKRLLNGAVCAWVAYMLSHLLSHFYA